MQKKGSYLLPDLLHVRFWVDGDIQDPFVLLLALRCGLQYQGHACDLPPECPVKQSLKTRNCVQTHLSYLGGERSGPQHNTRV